MILRKTTKMYVHYLLFVGLALSVTASGDESKGVPKIGEVLPDIQLQSVLGIPASFRPPEGKCLLVQFWDVRDEETKEIVEQVNFLYQRFHESGLNAVGICVNSSEDRILNFAENWRILWPQVLNQQDDENLTEKYGIVDIPFNLIVNSSGKVAAMQLVSLDDHKTVADILGVSLDDLPIDAVKINWKETFYSIYRLDEDEVIKRIPSPFIPERKQYYLNEHKTQAEHVPEGAGIMIFHWDGKLKHWGMSFSNGPTPLSEVLTFALQFAFYEFEGPDDLLKMNLHGDWIVREPSTPEEKIRALEKLIQTEKHEAIQIELKDVEREVFIARGDYAYRPLQGFERNDRYDVIHVFSDADRIRRGGGGGSGTLAEFLRSFGSLYKVHVIDETNSPEVTIDYRWRQYRAPSDSEGIGGYLKILSKQTSIQFHKEKRTVPVWMISLKEE